MIFNNLSLFLTFSNLILLNNMDMKNILKCVFFMSMEERSELTRLGKGSYFNGWLTIIFVLNDTITTLQNYIDNLKSYTLDKVTKTSNDSNTTFTM